jgi:hypothetical protein
MGSIDGGSPIGGASSGGNGGSSTGAVGGVEGRPGTGALYGRSVGISIGPGSMTATLAEL